MIIKEITIDLWKKYTAPIEINQYEAEGRGLKINITAGSLPVNLTGVNVSLHAKKPDGHVTHNACTIIDAVNGKVLYTISGQTCIKDGELECCLVLINSGPAELRSQTFIITVKPSPDISSSEESTSEFTALTEALAMVAGLTPSGSLVQDEDGLHLIGDEASPADGKFYGVLGGARGFYDLISGWFPMREWVRVNKTTFTVDGDITDICQKGDPLKWTQNGTIRYSNIKSISYNSGTNKTTITKHDGYISTAGDCDILDTYPITNCYFSKYHKPQGFPYWFSFNGIVRGATTAGSITTAISECLQSFCGDQTYVKICLASFNVSGSPAGQVQITGLLVPSGHTGYTEINGYYERINTVGSAGTAPFMYMATGESVINLSAYRLNAFPVATDASTLISSTSIYVDGFYKY